MLRLRDRWLGALLLSAGCQFDFDELYVYRSPDGGMMEADAGDSGDAAKPPRSSHLIGLWGDYPTVDDECIRCAESACAQAEAECRADPECVEFTRCVAENPTPAGQNGCRWRHLAWVTSGDVVQRDVNGPYGQCVFRDLCVNECEGAADLACLQNYAWPMTAEQSVPLDLTVNDSQDFSRMLPNVTVKVCPEGDTLCSTPLSTGVTDERGRVQLQLPSLFSRAFTGFLELQGGGITPTLLKFAWNIGGPTVQLITPIHSATYDFFVKILPFTIDETRGVLQTRMLGCSALTTRGVSFSSDGLDAESRSWYVENGVPSFTATQTSVLGAGGVFNVPPGYQLVTATRASDGVVVGRANAPVRPGFVTIVIFEPLAQ